MTHNTDVLQLLIQKGGGGVVGVGGVVKLPAKRVCQFLDFNVHTGSVLKTSATTKSKETDKHIQLIKMKISTLTGNLVFVCFSLWKVNQNRFFFRFEILADFQC